MNNVVDPELKAIHIAVQNLFNREKLPNKPHTSPVASIKATDFLANQAILFADAAWYLLEDIRRPLNSASALLRTCLEAQAKANHIIALAGEEREKLAFDFLQLQDAGHEYFDGLALQKTKDFKPDASNTLPRELPYLAAIKPLVENAIRQTLRL